MGAIGTGGSEVIDSVLVDQLRISPEALLAVVERERNELRRQQALYRGERPPELAGMTVLLVDDGIATGASMSAAIGALRQTQPRSIVVAVPVAPEETCRRLRRQADDVVCCRMPDDFGGVGAWYENFDQVSDDEVRRLLRR
jgi:predicted phosphoribosyltransferase